MLSPSMRFRPILAGLLLLISIDGRAQSQAAREEIQRILGPPLTPEQQRAADSYRTAEYLCRQKLESAPPDAIASCQDAVKVSKQLAPQRLIERSTVLSMLGQAFFVNRRFADALPQFEQAVEIRRQSGGSNNEGVAALLELVGLTHYALRDFAKANDAMQASRWKIHFFSRLSSCRVRAETSSSSSCSSATCCTRTRLRSLSRDVEAKSWMTSNVRPKITRRNNAEGG